MCRVKAIASSVERLLQYANCSGSSEAGSTEQMLSLTSFSKHLQKLGVRAMSLQSFKHVILFFFGMGTMVDFFKHAGTTDRESVVLYNLFIVQKESKERLHYQRTLSLQLASSSTLKNCHNNL